MGGTLIAGKLSNGTNELDLSQYIRGQAKAWLVFNGVGAVNILRSFNVTSITDDAVGRYTVNFDKPFTNANYVVTGSAGWDNTTYAAALIGHHSGQVRTVDRCPFQVSNSTTGGPVDQADVMVAFFGD